MGLYHICSNSWWGEMFQKPMQTSIVSLFVDTFQYFATIHLQTSVPALHTHPNNWSTYGICWVGVGAQLECATFVSHW